MGSLFMLLVVDLFSVTLISLCWLLTWVVVFMFVSARWFFVLFVILNLFCGLLFVNWFGGLCLLLVGFVCLGLDYVFGLVQGRFSGVWISWWFV